MLRGGQSPDGKDMRTCPRPIMLLTPSVHSDEADLSDNQDAFANFARYLSSSQQHALVDCLTSVDSCTFPCLVHALSRLQLGYLATLFCVRVLECLDGACRVCAVFESCVPASPASCPLCAALRVNRAFVGTMRNEIASVC